MRAIKGTACLQAKVSAHRTRERNPQQRWYHAVLTDNHTT